MGKLYDAIVAFDDWYWGIPVLFILVGGGIVLSIIIENIQFTKFGFIMKHTFGAMMDAKGEREKRSKGITSLQAVTAALGGTIGTGNIVGVASAIMMGGPGALFWMWVCGFVAMGIKYCEVDLGVAFRQKSKHTNGYLAGPFVYVRDGLHWKALAYIISACLLVLTIVVAAVHSSTIKGTMSDVGVPPIVTTVVIVIISAIIVFGGMKWLVKMTDFMVPFMAIFYIICCLIVIFANITNIGTVFAEIFKGAFTGQAAIGGFAGAAVMTAIRQGLARGVFSNDAGCSLQAILHAQAETIEYPAEQAIWAVFETFIDTIVVCTMTGLMILFTGVWTSGAAEETIASNGLATVLGGFGKFGCVLSLVLFALSSLMAVACTVPSQALEIFDSPSLMKFMQILFLVSVTAGCLADVSSTFIMADLGNGIVLCLNMICMIALGKVLRSDTRNYLKHVEETEKKA